MFLAPSNCPIAPRPKTANKAPAIAGTNGLPLFSSFTLAEAGGDFSEAAFSGVSLGVGSAFPFAAPGSLAESSGFTLDLSEECSAALASFPALPDLPNTGDLRQQRSSHPRFSLLMQQSLWRQVPWVWHPARRLPSLPDQWLPVSGFARKSAASLFFRILVLTPFLLPLNFTQLVGHFRYLQLETARTLLMRKLMEFRNHGLLRWLISNINTLPRILQHRFSRFR